MTKLTKEQVKFFIETMTDDMHNTTQHEIAETLLSKFDECESLQAKLLAYEQAAKNPVAWIVHMRTGDQFTTDSDFVGLGESTHGIHSTPLYAAPVLSKQPELHELLLRAKQLMYCAGGTPIENSLNPMDAWLYDAECAAIAPAQPVIPEGLIKAINRLLDNDGSRGCFDALEQHRAKTELELLLAAAQPVSELYKLPDGWKLVPEEATIAMLTLLGLTGRFDFMQQKYKNMLAAAPAQESE